MVPSGKAHNEMILATSLPTKASRTAIIDEGKLMVGRDRIPAASTIETSVMNARSNARSALALFVGARQARAHTLSVLVDNEPGVLARVVGLFSGRGYNIESLTVAEAAHGEHLSRITIVTSGTPVAIEQIKPQLERLVPIHKVTDLTLSGRSIERELAMVKVRGKGETVSRPAPGRRLPRAGDRRVDRELRVRADRQADKIEQLSS